MSSQAQGACGKADHRPLMPIQTFGRAGPRMPIPRTRLSAMVLIVVLCAHFAHARDQLAPDYEACEAALAQERMERKVERARLESELAALRRRVESELQKPSEAFGTLENSRAAHAPALGAPSARTVTLNHAVSSFTDVFRSNPSSPARPQDEVLDARLSTGRAASGRSMLQVGSGGRACSKAETRTVLAAADPTPSVMEMLSTNPACALCIIPCADKPGVDVVICVQGCQHQEENRCDNSTGIRRIAPLVSTASLDDRDSLVRMLVAVESDCTPFRMPSFVLLPLHARCHGGACLNISCHLMGRRMRRPRPRPRPCASLC